MAQWEHYLDDKVTDNKCRNPKTLWAGAFVVFNFLFGASLKALNPGIDLGFTSALTYDFEVFSTAQDRWLEISSVSNFETYQANRLKLRFKDKDGKNKLAHTLNGSALALPRVMAGILENYQTLEGIKIPEVLIPYCGFDFIPAPNH